MQKNKICICDIMNTNFTKIILRFFKPCYKHYASKFGEFCDYRCYRSNLNVKCCEKFNKNGPGVQPQRQTAEIPPKKGAEAQRNPALQRLEKAQKGNSQQIDQFQANPPFLRDLPKSKRAEPADKRNGSAAGRSLPHGGQ